MIFWNSYIQEIFENIICYHELESQKLKSPETLKNQILNNLKNSISRKTTDEKFKNLKRKLLTYRKKSPTAINPNQTGPEV